MAVPAVSSLATGFGRSFAPQTYAAAVAISAFQSPSSSPRVPCCPPPKIRSTVIVFATRPSRSGRPDGPGMPKGSKDGNFVSQDINYLWKLAAGSFGGAAIIKYGSALFPDITKPNIFEALLMIVIPLTVSVLLLIEESITDNQN